MTGKYVIYRLDGASETRGFLALDGLPLVEIRDSRFQVSYILRVIGEFEIIDRPPIE
jgi:hypothetical protein